MAMNYEEGLQAQLDADPQMRKSAFGRRAARVMNCKNASRKAKALARMEAHSRAHVGFQGSDWSKVSAPDWKSIIQMLMSLMPLILALFGL